MRVRNLLVMAVAALLAGCGVSPTGVPHPPSVPSSAVTAHFLSGGLAFDYPPAWQWSEVDRILHYETVVAFLTSGATSASEPCDSGYVPGLGSGCTQVIDLAPDSVVVRITLFDLPSGTDGPIAPLVGSGWTSLTLDGQPAAFTTGDQAGQGIPGSDVVDTWTVLVPNSDNDETYTISAGIRGPDLTPIETQVEAMVRTIRIGPNP